MQTILTLRPTGHPIRQHLRSRGLPPVKLRDDDGDLKLFVLSFTAFFICFYSLIA